MKLLFLSLEENWEKMINKIIFSLKEHSLKLDLLAKRRLERFLRMIYNLQKTIPYSFNRRFVKNLQKEIHEILNMVQDVYLKKEAEMLLIIIFPLPINDFTKRIFIKKMEGVCATTLQRDFIIVSLSNRYSSNILRYAILHELVHSYRFEFISNSKKTIDFIIEEGIADFVATKLTGYDKVPWLSYYKRKLKRITLDKLKYFIQVKELYTLLFSDNLKTCELILYGDGKKVPKWFGYSLGYYFIEYISKKKKMPIRKILSTSRKKFITYIRCF